MSEQLYKGGNLLLERPLFEANGTTPIAPSDLTLCECELRQGDRVVKKLVLGVDDELRANDGDTALLLELTSAISRLCTRGPLRERWRIGVTAETHSAEPDQRICVLIVDDVLVLE